MKVVVVGAGITGCTAAYRLTHAGDEPHEVVLVEAGADAGGKVRSVVVGDIRLEAGPDSLLTRKPWAVDLCRELGLGDELVPAAAAPAHVWTRSGLLPFPSGPFGISTDLLALARWTGIPMAGRMRAAADLILPRRRESGDESLGSLLRRRVGDAATEALVAPLLGGLFGGDVDELSALAAFPELASWEREHGSLIRGARAATRGRRPSTLGPPPPMFVRPRGGLTRLIDALVGALGPRILTGAQAVSVLRRGARYVVDAGGDPLEADAVILTTPAWVTADLVEAVSPAASAALRKIDYGYTGVALLVYPEGTAERLPNSTGFVTRKGELPLDAATIVSRKWPEPAFGDRAVMRCFVRADGQDQRPDDEILDEVASCLASVLGLSEAPEDQALVRWDRSMPRYGVGHLDLVGRIEEALPPGLIAAGHAFRGAGLPDCVRQGTEAAARAVGLSPVSQP